MAHVPTRAARVILLATLAVLAGCSPLTSYRTPAPLKPGESAVGLGGAYMMWYPEDPSDVGFFPSIWYRTAVGDNTDFGVTWGLFEGVTVDFKHAVLRKPIILSGDIGATLVAFGGGDYFESDSGLILRPEVIAGTEHLFGSFYLVEPLTFAYAESAAGMRFGASIGGERFRLVPVFSMWWWDGYFEDRAYSYSLGLEWVSRARPRPPKVKRR